MIALPSLALLLGLALPSPAGAAQDAADLRRALSSDSAEERRTVYALVAELEADEREAAVRVVAAEHRRWSGAYQRARRRAEQLVNDPRSASAKRRQWTEAWERAAVEAMAAIHDEELFPNPPGPVNGPFTGYEAVMERVSVAVELHDRLYDRAQKDLRGLLKADDEELVEWNRDLHGSHARASELAAALTELGAPTTAPQGLAPMKAALLALAAEDWERALLFHAAPASSCRREWAGPKEPVEVNPFAPPGSAPLPGPRVLGAASAPLEGYERFLFHVLYGQRVELHNAQVDEGFPRVLRAGVRINNHYRQRLGVRPLQLHVALNQAMREHLRSLRELTHEGLTPETRTARMRVVRAGYPNPDVAGENLSSGDLSTAMEDWKWDGGHHRVLVQPCSVHIGVFDSGNSGMVVGSGEEPALPSLAYLAFEL